MDERPGLTSRIGLLRPMRHRDFRLLWIGQTISMIGDGTYYVAVAWLVYQNLDGSPAAFAAVGVAWSLPQLVLRRSPEPKKYTPLNWKPRPMSQMPLNVAR